MEKEKNDGHKHSTPEGTAEYFRENPTMPVRVLVSTATHLVPGCGFTKRVLFMRNLISQHHWNHDFEWGRDRFRAYNAMFGYDNRACYFLVDHGQSPNGNDDAVPILWYRWTGETLTPIHQALPSAILKKLKKYPFTLPHPLSTRSQPVPRNHQPRQLSATEKRASIWRGLRYSIEPSNEELDFVRENPEHAAWLERNMEPRLWSQLKLIEAQWQKFQRIQIMREQPEQPEDCTGMWDCECALCSWWQDFYS